MPNKKCERCKHDEDDEVEWYEYCERCIYESCRQVEDNFEPKEEAE